jgi:hypothetical protein
MVDNRRKICDFSMYDAVEIMRRFQWSWGDFDRKSVFSVCLMLSKSWSDFSKSWSDLAVSVENYVVRSFLMYLAIFNTPWPSKIIVRPI